MRSIRKIFKLSYIEIHVNTSMNPWEFHTIKGKVRMKRSAREAGTITNNERDTGTENGLTIDSPDDLFKYGMDIDFDKLNYTPLKFNIECSAKSDFK